MKPKLICDNCGESLKSFMEDNEESVAIIPDKINGFQVMKHNNCHNFIVLCDSCQDEAREELKENEQWSDLEEWDMYGEVKEFYKYAELVKEIENLTKKK